MQKTFIIILTAITVAFGILCAVQWKQLRASRARALAAEQAWQAEAEAREVQSARVKELERVRQRLDQQVQEFTTVTTKLRTNEEWQASKLAAMAERVQAMQKVAGGAPAGSSVEGKEGIFGKGMGEMLGKMMKDPAMREMVRGQQKAAINMMYSGLLKELNLSPEEREKLTGILTEAQMKNVEAAQGLFGQQQEGAGEDIQKQFLDSRKQTDAELKALLGDDRFAQYEDYQKNLGERMQLNQLSTHLEAQNLPLQAQQTAQLLEAMKEEKAAVPPVIPSDATQVPKKELFTAENLGKQLQWMDDYNRRVLERAGQILSPEQLKQYREFQEQQASMQKFGLKMARDMFGAGKSGSAQEPVPAK